MEAEGREGKQLRCLCRREFTIQTLHFHERRFKLAISLAQLILIEEDFF